MAGRTGHLTAVVWALLVLTLVVASQGATDSNGLQTNPNQENATTFEWLNAQKDVVIWGRIESSFHAQIEPDGADAGALKYEYRYLRRVGLSGSTALVIVSNRTKQTDRKGEYTLAFNYDIDTGAISEIVDPERDEPVVLYMYDWKFIRQARFDSSPNPDVVFTYRNCWECEDELILAALQYDPEVHKWQVRSWGDGTSRWWMTRVGLVVDKDLAFTDVQSFQCLYDLFDSNANGFDSVVIRCRQVNKDKEKEDSTIIYSLKQGKFVGELVTRRDQLLKIWSALCQRSTGSKLCKNGTAN